MDTNKSIISLSHNDLDGIGCQVVLRWQYTNVYYKTISYNRIYDTLVELDNNLDYDRTKSQIFISDLSLKPNEILLLKTICEKNPDVKIILADHHIRTPDIVELYKSFPKNFIDLHTEQQCSAMILFYYFGVNNNKIRELIELVNSYDLWLVDRPNFMDALILNEIYESMSHQDFFNSIGFYGNIKEDITRKIDKSKTKIQSFQDGIVQNNYIYYNDKIVVAHIDRYKSILQYYLDRPISVIISSNFNFSVRLSNSLKDYELIDIRNVFFEYFNERKYNYYYAHKQVFGFNSTETTVIDDIDSFLLFIGEKFN